MKIYFGYAAGVGKREAMLGAARELIADGIEVWIDPEVERKAGGRSLAASARGSLDLDEALRRRPELVLLPSLADRNPAGVRHKRRYQDVAELLDAGIDVWSTLEVRHIESLADVVERITSSPNDQLVPDLVFDSADEIELVDLPPEDLLDRLRAAARPGAARAEVPDRPTLVALRELALRRAADRLHAHEQARRAGGGRRSPVWRTTERLLACVGPSPTSARVIRTAIRMARSMHAPWIAVYAGELHELGEQDERLLSENLRLAESLGAETKLLPGGNVPLEIVDFARARGATKIIIGKTGTSVWRSYLKRSLVDRVIALSGDIDVYVIRGMAGQAEGSQPAPRQGDSGLRAYAGAAAVLGVATAVATTFELLGLTETNLVLAYLLGVTAVAAWFGRGPAILASLGAVLAFNFFFTSPRFTLHVHNTGYLFTFAVMLVIGLLVSALTARIQAQSTAARQKERRAEQLYQLSRELSATSGQLQIVAAAEARLCALLGGEAAILLADEKGDLRPAGPASPRLAREPALLPAAEWAREHRRAAGAGTETHDDAPALCLPLTTPDGVAGVLAVRTRDPDLLLLPDRRHLVETLAAQVALALQRDRLTEKVHRSIAQAESERLRNAVLTSVSHDFRTPLAAITGASSSLLDAGDRIRPAEQRALLQSIYDEGDRLGRLVENLLHMTRLESGQLEPRREWNLMEDLVGSALTRLAGPLASRAVTTSIPRDLPMVRVDGVLVELVIVNLLDNAAKYSWTGTPIDVTAYAGEAMVFLAVADRGPGLGAEEKARAFEKFFRGRRQLESGSRGAGLGLAICSAIAQLHGGTLCVEDREGGGARFVFALPIETQPPAVGGQASDGEQGDDE